MHSRKELLAWMREYSLDTSGLKPVSGRLSGFELVVALVDAPWESVTVQDMDEALKQALPRVMLDPHSEEYPQIDLGGPNPETVYAFSTREGGTGVLQTVADTENGTVLRFHYKLVQRSTPSSPQKPNPSQAELNQPTRTVMLPDVDRRDCPTVLDLASGELIENIARDGDASGYIRLGKGDLWQDGGYFGTVRDARAMLWDGTQFAPFEAIRPDGGSSTGYGKLKLPCRLLIATAEKTHHDVTILWMDGQGSARVDHRRADPSIVPKNGIDDVAVPVAPISSNNLAEVRATLAFVEAAFTRYKLDTGQYPTTAEGLNILVRQPGDMAPANWRGPYLKEDSILLDPWGHPYQYEYIEKNGKPRVWSKGPDHKSGTSDDIPPNEVLANRIKSGTQLSGIGKAMLIYANDHDDVLPPDLESLVSEAELHPRLLVSPRKPEGFVGPSYIYIAGQDIAGSSTSINPNNVLAYENPDYCQGGINVLYLDSHVAWETPDRFMQELAATYNRLGRSMPNSQFKNSANTEPHESDDAVFEMVINDLDDDQGHEAVDLDKTKQYELPEEWDDPVARLKWTKQNGVDLFADYARNRWAIMTSDLTLKRCANEFWGRLGPAEVRKLVSSPQKDDWGSDFLKRNQFQFYILERGAKAPQTFTFETREGALGVLQITEFQDKPRGMKIRYRLVTRADH
ncbi:MAG: hypothetical protein GY809_12250 [Planctomycetes bacterium]|nr:hypothetical protein [Planctomycetota bacterium]